MANLVVWERRILRASLGCGILGSILMLISLTNTYWVYVHYDVPSARNDSAGNIYYKIAHYHGLWKFCRDGFSNLTGTDNYYSNCSTVRFSYEGQNEAELVLDRYQIDSRRAAALIVLIGEVMSFGANFATWYAIGQARYMYKRLAGSLQLMTAICCLVTAQVFEQSVHSEMEKERQRKHKAKEQLCFCYYLIYVCCGMFILVGIVLFVTSKKRKGEKARDENEALENEPVHIRR